MRVKRLADAVVGKAHGFEDLLVVETLRAKESNDLRSHGSPRQEERPAFFRLLAHLFPFAHAFAEAAEKETLDIVRGHDVDAGGKAGYDLTARCRAVLKKMMQEVVVADRERETIDVCSQLFGNIAGIGVAEVAAGERETHRFGVTRNLLRRVEVDGTLNGDANPVERVDRRYLSARLNRFRLHHRFDQTEAVVVAALDGDVADVRALNASHLLALQR